MTMNYMRISLSPPLKPGVGIRDDGFFKSSKLLNSIFDNPSTAEKLFSFLRVEAIESNIISKFIKCSPKAEKVKDYIIL